MNVSSAHIRYTHQALWTKELRSYIFGEIGFNASQRALEIGCGTGAILSEIKPPVFGLDLSLSALKEAQVHTRGIHPLTCADASHLPFPQKSFDVVFSHFLLLWLPNPQNALKEMLRVTKQGGYIIAFAEPNYSQRIDEPAPLKELGKWQREALMAQGANPDFGASLAKKCYEAGIEIIETGIISPSTREAVDANRHKNEWDTLEDDLRGRVHPSSLQKMKGVDATARARGERVLYVPTHYLLGKK